ncbi:hypothetical protein CEXT_145871 [Caerostris extrusa]|uniref:Uncharacterized protein n=1 Tax=Caerostris extrusa TaxID=172846 RepID=A0AAV4YB02_CAEEX|nr:hypothetical protein CEXT_145871 [Caerostris extrusa]
MVVKSSIQINCSKITISPPHPHPTPPHPTLSELTEINVMSRSQSSETWPGRDGAGDGHVFTLSADQTMKNLSVPFRLQRNGQGQSAVSDAALLRHQSPREGLEAALPMDPEAHGGVLQTGEHIHPLYLIILIKSPTPTT